MCGNMLQTKHLQACHLAEPSPNLPRFALGGYLSHFFELSIDHLHVFSKACTRRRRKFSSVLLWSKSRVNMLFRSTSITCVKTQCLQMHITQSKSTRGLKIAAVTRTEIIIIDLQFAFLLPTKLKFRQRSNKISTCERICWLGTNLFCFPFVGRSPLCGRVRVNNPCREKRGQSSHYNVSASELTDRVCQANTLNKAVVAVLNCHLECKHCRVINVQQKKKNNKKTLF